MFKRLGLLQVDYVAGFSLITRQGAAHQAAHFTDTSRLFINIDFRQARLRLYCRYFVQTGMTLVFARLMIYENTQKSCGGIVLV